MEKLRLVKIAKAAAPKGLVRTLLFSLLFPALGLIPSTLSAEVPVKFTYQGNLRQSGFLVTGNRSMVFRLYSSSTSPTVLWTSPANSVGVSTGVFRVTLEPTLADWQSGNLWLELEVEGNRMSPREEITSSPYAVNTLMFSGKRYTTSGVAPSTGSVGDLWMDTASGSFRVWNGSEWVFTGGGDSLGSHTATKDLDMAHFNVGNAGVIEASSVTAGKFAGDGSGLEKLDASKITSGFLNGDRIPAGIIRSTHIADGSIQGQDLADSSVNRLKLAQSGCINGQLLQWDESQLQWKCVNASVGGLESDPLSIHVQSTLQSGAVFHVSSGTVNDLTVGNSLNVSGYVYADGFCVGGNCQTGTMGTYKGATAGVYDGNRGGYAAANALCAAEYPGSHICTNGEILFSINSGNFASFPANTTLWISNGPPGYVANANDCQGWNSESGMDYGPVWNRLATGEGFGSLNKCHPTIGTPRAFACCS